MSVIEFNEMYRLDSDTGPQSELRKRYHSSILADLRGFAESAEGTLDISSKASEILAQLGLDDRLSPGLIYVHTAFAVLIGESVSINSLFETYSELLEALEQPTVPRLKIQSFAHHNFWHKRFRRSTLDQEAQSAEFDDVNSRIAASIEPISELKLLKYQDDIQSVLTTFSIVAPSAHGDITQLVSDIAVFHGGPVTGASASAFLGCVLIAEPRGNSSPWAWFADNLTHEAAHHRLYMAMMDDPLVDGLRTVCSPLRNDPRPLLGVVHAMFVETKLIDTFQKLLSIDAPVEADELNKKLSEFLELHRQCVEVVSKNEDALTAGGRELLEYCRSIML